MLSSLYCCIDDHFTVAPLTSGGVMVGRGSQLWLNKAILFSASGLVHVKMMFEIFSSNIWHKHLSYHYFLIFPLNLWFPNCYDLHPRLMVAPTDIPEMLVVRHPPSQFLLI